MSAKTVQFSVEVKNLAITAGSYRIYGYTPSADPLAPVTPKFVSDGTYEGNTFSESLSDATGNRLLITVFIKRYTLNGVSYDVPGTPIALVASFFLPHADYIVKVCPESTISTIYTFAQITSVEVSILQYAVGVADRNMRIAYEIKQNIFRTEGGVADMIKTSPNGFETNSYPMFNSLCNLFYYCLTNPVLSSGKTFYTQFLEYAWHDADELNITFIDALHNMLYDPFYNAREIYDMLAAQPEVYTNSLTSMVLPEYIERAPKNWTLTLKSNSSGAKNFIPAGAAFVVFDKADNAWVANNFRAGANNSGTHCMVYQYNLKPASFSPVQGGGLLGVGFGAAIDPKKEYISFGNFGWGPELNNPQEGSISRFYYQDGKPVSPSNGYTPGLSRVQGMNYDTAGNLWMASVGCQDPFAPGPEGVYPFASEPSAVVLYLDGNPETMRMCNTFPVKRNSAETSPTYLQTPYLKIFDVVPDNQGGAYVSCIGNYDRHHPENCALSAVYKVAYENDTIVVKSWWFSDFYSDLNKQYGFESLRQIALNSKGDVVVVGVASSRATILAKDLLEFKGYYEVNTFAPWGVKIDKNQTVFLANFGEENGYIAENTLDMKGPFGVTMLRDPSHPETAKVLTVPTGGAEVTLANGQPLYGTQTKLVNENGVPVKCYQPIMRLTSTNIDGAGNLWCMNNWKPSAAVDVANNPGGDGVVLFLGIAAPE